MLTGLVHDLPAHRTCLSEKRGTKTLAVEDFHALQGHTLRASSECQKMPLAHDLREDLGLCGSKHRHQVVSLNNETILRYSTSSTSILGLSEVCHHVCFFVRSIRVMTNSHFDILVNSNSTSMSQLSSKQSSPGHV